jgi:hypothetical protein
MFRIFLDINISIGEGTEWSIGYMVNDGGHGWRGGGDVGIDKAIETRNSSNSDYRRVVEMNSEWHGLLCNEHGLRRQWR